MRSLALTLLFSLVILFCAPAYSANINGGMSGSYYNPDNNGTGINVEILSPAQGIAYWYTYGLTGEPRWFLLIGEIAGDRLSGEMYAYEGMTFGDFDPGSLQQERFGTFSITYSSCDALRFSFTPSVGQAALGYSAGRLDMQRLSSPLGVSEQCDGAYTPTLSKSPVSGAYTGEVIIDGERDEMVLAIAEDGQIFAMSELTGVYSGYVSTNQSSFAGKLTALPTGGLPDGDYFAVLDISGSVIGESVSFEASLRSRATGRHFSNVTFSGTSSGYYEVPLTHAKLTGSWSSLTGSDGLYAEIDSSGRITASGGYNDCTFHGTVRPIDNRFSMGTGSLLPARCADEIEEFYTTQVLLILSDGNLIVLTQGGNLQLDVWAKD